MSGSFFLLLGTIVVAVGAWIFSRRRQLGTRARTTKLTDAMLIEKVRLAIKPEFPKWVLFSNGTYVIVEDEAAIADPRAYALKQMSEFGPVRVASPAGDFSITTLHKTEGWSVAGHGYGMYTYVHPSELRSNRPSDVKIGLHGRRKRDADSKELRIVYVSGAS
jgi:hypothetical protein